jgi:hypothetical protein
MLFNATCHFQQHFSDIVAVWARKTRCTRSIEISWQFEHEKQGVLDLLKYHGGLSMKNKMYSIYWNIMAVWARKTRCIRSIEISWWFEHEKQGVLDLLKYGGLSMKNKVYSIYCYDKVCQWFDAGTTIPSTNKTNRNYIAKILWTVMLDTNNQKSLGHLNPDYPVSLD